MDAELIKRLFPNASGSTLLRNASGPSTVAATIPTAPAAGKRIRQSQKPKMNKLEAEWFAILSSQFPNYDRPRAQSKRYELGNGIWYKPDFTATSWPQPEGPSIETAWEVKGPHAFRGGFENLKVAARLWTEVRWILVWKEAGEWRQQVVLP